MVELLKATRADASSAPSRTVEWTYLGEGRAKMRIPDAGRYPGWSHKWIWPRHMTWPIDEVHMGQEHDRMIWSFPNQLDMWDWWTAAQAHGKRIIQVKCRCVDCRLDEESKS